VELSKRKDLFSFVQEHHLGLGESVSFKCPHCSKGVTVLLKMLAGDSDTIQVYWGKNLAEVEKKRERADEERSE
jgi:hypothetical protein